MTVRPLNYSLGSQTPSTSGKRAKPSPSRSLPYRKRGGPGCPQSEKTSPGALCASGRGNPEEETPAAGEEPRGLWGENSRGKEDRDER